MASRSPPGPAAASAQPKTATSASPETSASPKSSETKVQNGQSEKNVAAITHADLPKGALVETKKGKKGVVTHHDMKDSAVFLKDQETGQEVPRGLAWSSVAKIDGKEVPQSLAEATEAFKAKYASALDEMTA